MTIDSNAGDDDRALFVSDFYPELGEYLAERHASGYDAVAARTRFLLWLGTHVEDRPGLPGLPTGADPWSPRIPDHTVKAVTEFVLVQRRLARELGREPTPEELAAELRAGPD